MLSQRRRQAAWAQPRLGAPVCSSLIREGGNRHTFRPHSAATGGVLWNQEGTERRSVQFCVPSIIVFLVMANSGSPTNKICVFSHRDISFRTGQKSKTTDQIC